MNTLTCPEPASSKRLLSLAIAGFFLWIYVLSLGRVNEFPVHFVSTYLTFFLVYCFAVHTVLSSSFTPLNLSMILIAGVVYRIIFIQSEPSDDIYRYLWEGRVFSEGLNPYLLSPDSSALDSLSKQSVYHELINHKDYTAIYPPLMLYWHMVVIFFSETPLALKLSFLFGECLLNLAIIQLLKKKELSPSRVLIYWWNPLPIFAIAIESHHESVYILLLMLALLGLFLEKPLSAVFLWSLSVLSKGFSLVLLPIFLKGRVCKGGLVFLATATLCCLPFLLNPESLFYSLLKFGGDLHYNDSLHALIHLSLKGLGVGGASFLSRVCVVVIYAFFVLWVMTKTQPDPLRRTLLLMSGLMMLLPTVHVWYLLVLLPLLCFYPWPGWIALTGTCMLPFLAQMEIWKTNKWVEWHLLKIPEYAPLYLWLFFILWKQRNKKSLVEPKSRPPDF